MPRLTIAIPLLVLALHGGLARAAAPADNACIRPLATSPAALEADAQRAFRARRYAAAFARYARLADAGHAPSAETALFMLLHGPELIANDWTASEQQQACWNALVVARARHRVPVDTTAASE